MTFRHDSPGSALSSTTAGPGDDCLDIIVIGAGQAGLSVAWHLARQGRRFLVLDAASELGHAWRSRWDSLRLFTPAQYDGLPGMPFPAPADTYPTKDEVADYLAEYADRFELPVLLNTTVTSLEQEGDGFAVHTSQGTLRAQQVVVATGPFQNPVIPPVAEGLDPAVVQLHSVDYRNPSQLPAGPVVVVGAGNSGLQIADELADQHPVTVAVGARSPQLPQRFLGQDLFWWLTRLRLISKPADSRLARRMRGRGDLIIGSSLKALRRRGVTIGPRVVSTSAKGVTLADGTQVAAASVVWATGFRSDYSWIHVPRVLSDGRVLHERGVSEVPGLFFLGLPWQHTRGSALLGFVKEDAAWLAEQMCAGATPVTTTAPRGAGWTDQHNRLDSERTDQANSLIAADHNPNPGSSA
jgi:putative flavoprotein involved in K+ transport